MKVGDLVQVQGHDPVTPAGHVWHEFMGKTGVVVSNAKRIHTPAVKVFISGQIAEFDVEELVKVGEQDG